MIERILYATCAAFCFGFLINLRGKQLFFAGISAFISILTFELCGSLGFRPFVGTFVAAITFSIYAEIMARQLKCTVSTFSLSGLLPIAPGGTLFLAIDAFVKSEFELGQSYAVTALINALLLGIGILIVGSITPLIIPKNKK